MQITVYGQSSKTTKQFEVITSDLDLTMLQWLRDHNIPIASSCRGLGICDKCLINERHLSCEYTVKRYLDEVGTQVNVSYL